MGVHRVKLLKTFDHFTSGTHVKSLKYEERSQLIYFESKLNINLLQNKILSILSLKLN